MEALEAVEASKETPMKYLKGIKGHSTKEGMQSAAQLKCHYRNIRSWKPQCCLKTMTWQQSLKLGGMNPIGCSIAINGYRFFRGNRQGRKGRVIDLHIRKQLECEELSLENCHKEVESLWIRIRDTCNKGNLVVAVYYRPPGQEESRFWSVEG